MKKTVKLIQNENDGYGIYINGRVEREWQSGDDTVQWLGDFLKALDPEIEFSFGSILQGGADVFPQTID